MNASTIVNGVLLGGLFATVGLGLSLVFGILRLPNFAHGEFVIGGAFLASTITSGLGVDPLVALPIVAIAAAAIGWLLQRGLLTGLMLAGGETASVVATFGLSLLLQGVFIAAYGSNDKSLSASYASTGIDILGVQVRVILLIALGFAVVLAIIVQLFMTRTRRGTQVRAAASDPATAEIVGIDVRRIYAAVFAVGAGIAAISGVLIGVAFSYSPSSGFTWVVVGFAVVVLGGVGNVAGTLLGGIAFGLAETVTSQLAGAGYGQFAVYALLLLLLLVLPRGIGRGRIA
jgi:branched-chain amino acid transport system permease protein